VLLELVVCGCSQLVQGLARRVLLALLLSPAESWCSAGTMKTSLLLLHVSDHALLLLLRGVVVLSSDCGEGVLVQGPERKVSKRCFNGGWDSRWLPCCSCYCCSQCCHLLHGRNRKPRWGSW
jgi:hypothetical protein